MKQLFRLLIIVFKLAFLSMNCFAESKYIKKVNVYCQVEESCSFFKTRIESGNSKKEAFNELVQMEPFDKFPAQFESLKEEYLGSQSFG